MLKSYYTKDLNTQILSSPLSILIYKCDCILENLTFLHNTFYYSYMHALCKHSDNIVLDNQVFFYRQVFSDPVDP